MIKSIISKTLFLLVFSLGISFGQEADPIEAVRQAKLAAEKAAAEAEAATGAAIEAAAAKAAAAAREKVIADRKAEEERKRLEKEAAEAAEVDAAAEAAALEARRKLAAELGLELNEVADSSVTAELANQDTTENLDEDAVNALQGFNFGLSSSIGIASGQAFENVPLGGTIVISTPYGAKVGPLDLTLSIGGGYYTGEYQNESFNPTFFGLGANAVLMEFVFSETHVGVVGSGLGIRQFNGITLERVMKKSLNLPFNLLIGGEGFISTDIDGTETTTGWGGLGVRLDISI